MGQSAALGMQFLILGWLVLELTDSPAQLGLVVAIYGVPNLAMLMFGGIVADRLDRRWMLFYSRLIVTALIVLAATLTLYQVINIWYIYVIAFTLGTIQGLNMPAQMAIVPDLVDEEDILNATSLNMAVFNAGRIMGPSVAGLIIQPDQWVQILQRLPIIGPSIAGWIIQIAGIDSALYFTALCYVISCILLFTMTGVSSRAQSERTNIARDFADGIRFVVSTPIAYTMVGLSFAFGFFGAAYVQVLPAFGKEVLELNADGVGILLTVAGLGSLAGNMFLAALGNTPYKNWLLLGMIILFGATLFLFALTSVYALSLVLLFFTGVGFTGFISMGTTVLQLSTPPELRGRMMSLWLIGAALHYIGAWPLGAVGEYMGWAVSLGGGALIMLAFVLWLGILRPTLRQSRV